jgi:hypothetical protein
VQPSAVSLHPPRRLDESQGSVHRSPFLDGVRFQATRLIKSPHLSKLLSVYHLTFRLLPPSRHRQGTVKAPFMFLFPSHLISSHLPSFLPLTLAPAQFSEHHLEISGKLHRLHHFVALEAVSYILASSAKTFSLMSRINVCVPKSAKSYHHDSPLVSVLAFTPSADRPSKTVILLEG